MSARVIPLPEGSNEQGAQRQLRLPSPTFTKSQAVKAGLCTRVTYDQTLPLYEMVVRHHLDAGTPRDEREPMEIVGHRLSEPYISAGRQQLDTGLVRRIDPPLDESAALLARGNAQVEELCQGPCDISTAESNTRYSVQQAVMRHSSLSEQIEDDRGQGYSHHDRAPKWLVLAGKYAPWAESVGGATFATFFMNVNLLAPWEDPLGWTLAWVLIIYPLLGQFWLINRAASAHNHARECQADDLRHQAEASYHRRRSYLLVASGIAAVLTGAMLLRGVTALGDAPVSVMVVMVLLALTTGILMPTLSFLAKALDGSKISRERDGLAQDLDADRQAYDDRVAEVSDIISATQEIDDRLMTKLLPDILNSVQQTVNQALEPHSFLRLQIGSLAKEPPVAPAEPTIACDANGRLSGAIGNGIPGADAVNLKPVFDRLERRRALRQCQASLAARLLAVPPYPWTGGRER